VVTPPLWKGVEDGVLQHTAAMSVDELLKGKKR